eukprot:TRINITY_DN63530_c0_g1_i1.p1 TRINITY_DN63530_c0_g1~~TRINITY_DN63530_c0_g1_i1.p1  ORF type:complete len:267 (-),score=31.57 TRINITY_DN63530_c0_g1_i1:119-919(-)
MEHLRCSPHHKTLDDCITEELETYIPNIAEEAERAQEAVLRSAEVDKADEIEMQAKGKTAEQLQCHSMIWLYTLESPVYNSLTSVLGSAHQRDQIVFDFFPLIKFFLWSLSHCDRVCTVKECSTPTWRAQESPINKAMQQKFGFTQMATTVWTFFASSQDKEVVQSVFGSPRGVLFRLENVTGFDISEASSKPYEKEVLIVPLSEWLVEHFDDSKKPTEITLRMTDPGPVWRYIQQGDFGPPELEPKAWDLNPTEECADAQLLGGP